MAWQVRKAVIPGILVLAAMMGTAYLVRTKPVVEPLDKVEQPWLVAASQVGLADIQPKLRLYGEIVPGREVELRALVAGEVVAVADRFVDGGSLRQGDLIVAIDDFDYRAKFDELSSQVDEAKARLEEIQARRKSFAMALRRDLEMVSLHQRDVKRMNDLSGRGSVSDKRLDTARMDLTRQQKATEMRQSDLAAEAARVKQQQAVIDRLSVGVRRAERDLQKVRLIAPFDGFLADVQAQVGKRLSANDRVARLIDAGRLEARVTLSDRQYGRLVSEGSLAGRTVAITWQVGQQSFIYTGRLDRVGARIDSASGGVQVFVRLDDVGLSKPLRPGAFVTIAMPDRTFHKVAQLPESALYNSDTVYVIAGERLEKRKVELVARVGNDVLLRGEIEDGDQVVVTRFAEIGPGQKVEVR
ncbi:MAG: efflux RND transporter periplasmic adaptor subunit [Rhodospirillaceae bacterium]|jgi:RND family efflux transporter MFP subunit|nr:efflux RND transporter periplasmic adaptor subunit [Rhodospirillaceae bacterium]MBT4044360.1 efflux RND transporter periplasmic adaptor subunit [Rhodospirillaceae bacterium]MBT4690478.1 efflux RND transporter periplasmic adaptor subunit [Rhodospirillaceae bacterium]MBT5083196.1 efflux RND transporter periplasmic adaptor subunit [Rhodospirillaceae bacterium]MBT5526499.1 efflux RND transporter periplasmic adaptor subunit [Rhodospirillaceae bacterium]